LIKEYESIQKECSERNKKKASLEKIIKNNDKVTSDDILNHMPAFVDHIKDTE
jgi:hypothetical protein